MSVSANYFEKKNGSRVERNAFDYIRDHLGYRIELQDLVVSDGKLKNEKVLSLNLINRGFSTLFNEHDVYFVLIDESGQVFEFKTNADVHTWQPYNPDDVDHKPLIHSINTTIKIPSKGNYKLGFWVPDSSARLRYNNRYSIRIANGNTDWWVSNDKRYGVNILTDIQFR